VKVTEVMELPVSKLLRGKELWRIQERFYSPDGSIQHSALSSEPGIRWSEPGHSARRGYGKTGRELGAYRSL
jgi:hypothetical protein